MTLCLLARHAAHDLIDRTLVGRMDRVPLSEAGRRQAADLPRRLRSFRITCVQSSPRQRALETAAILAQAIGAQVKICPALDELDFGSWTGCTFDDLGWDPRWARWNDERSHTRPPGGEHMGEAQQRIITHLRDMHERHPDGGIVMVTHAEIIRAAVLHAMALPLGDWWRIEVAPASVTRLEMRSRTHSIVSLGTRAVAA